MRRELTALAGIVRHILLYLAFVARHFRLFHGVTGLCVLVLCLEYVATSLMIPMAPGSAGADSPVSRVWFGVAGQLGLEPTTRTWMWLFFLVMSARLALGYLLTVLTTWLGKQVHRSLSGKVFGHVLLHEPMERVYTRSVGYYITMAGDDTFKSGTIVSCFFQALIGLLTALVGLLVLYQFSAGLFAAVIAFLLGCLAAIAFLMRKALRLSEAATNLSRELGTTFVEALNGLRSIRSLRSQQFVMNRYADQIDRYVRTLVEIDAIRLGVKVFPAIVLLLVAAVALRPGIDAGMPEAALVAGTVIVIRVFASLGQVAMAGSQMLTDIRAVKDIRSLLQLGEEEQTGLRQPDETAIRTLALHDVHFGYDGRGPVLAGVSFRFEAGRTYAIIGPSGAGKSTLADVLLGLVEPDSGTIEVNEGALPLDAARQRFVLVEQQPKIFSTTIRENLRFGGDATDQEIDAVLELLDLDDLVGTLQESVDARLQYLGENFSGGQRQRLGIARALLRRPSVLILDEATSALDAPTRARIVARLRGRMRTGIIIFITHDETIAALADKVLHIGDEPHARGALHDAGP